MASIRPEISVVPTVRGRPPRGGDAPLAGHDLSGLLAHDLKTPLAAISMNLDFVLAELGLGVPDSLRAALEDCKEANVRAVRLVSDMADAVRLATGDRAPTVAESALAPLIEAAVFRVTPEATSRGLRILWTVGSEAVRVDPELTVRAVERLLERAVRHASGPFVRIDHRGGSIAIRTEVHRESTFGANERALATHFVDTVARAMGGRFWTEIDGTTLSYRMALPLAAAENV